MHRFSPVTQTNTPQNTRVAHTKLTIHNNTVDGVDAWSWDGAGQYAATGTTVTPLTITQLQNPKTMSPHLYSPRPSSKRNRRIRQHFYVPHHPSKHWQRSRKANYEITKQGGKVYEPEPGPTDMMWNTQYSLEQDGGHWARAQLQQHNGGGTVTVTKQKPTHNNTDRILPGQL
jgi:hypothetical protein